MITRTQLRDDRLKEQCDVVAKLIVSIRPVYQVATLRQRALLETIVGAGIWYIPKPARAWTGQISKGALKAFHPDSGVQKPRLSEEHVYPRKVTARLLLEDELLCGESLTQLFREKYGRVHFITAEENKTVQPFQRASVFSHPEQAYSQAGVVLIEITDDVLRLVKKRDRETIEHYLSQ